MKTKTTEAAPIISFPQFCFFIGIALLSFVSWIAPWFTSPVWISKPASEFDDTPWAVFGPIFMAMALGAPVALLLLFGGALTMAKVAHHNWAPFVAVTCGVLSMLGPYGTLEEYHPLLFATAGGMILVFAYLTVWFWIQTHLQLENEQAQLGHWCQLVSYLFLMTSLEAYSLLGNPFSGLFHYGRTETNPGSWPFLYAIGARVAIYLASGFVFSFMGNYFAFSSLQRRHQKVSTD